MEGEDRRLQYLSVMSSPLRYQTVIGISVSGRILVVWWVLIMQRREDLCGEQIAQMLSSS